MTPQSAAAVFQVSNLDAALKHYKAVFGFSEDFRFGDYAGIRLGAVSLHLSGHSIYGRPVGGGTVCICCDEIDGYYAELKKKGAEMKSTPKDYPYGMREFTVVDLDGNFLFFGCEANIPKQ